jgi:molybdopterin/thiamine biosynthesis adenylyltransferase
MTDWDRVQRLFGHDILQQLTTQTVGIIGLGSGGGYVAVSLAMCGVGKFILMDDDVLDAHNIVRHVADQRDIGRLKVDVVADLILQRNPQAQIRVFPERFEATESQVHLLDEMDVLAVGVDGEGAKFLLNQACLAHDLIAVYAGVYERGEGGDVTIIQPHSGGPCYACWASTLREGHITPAPNALNDLDYGQRRPDGTIAAEPGLWLDVVRIANTQANMVLNILLAGTKVERILPANTVIMANQPLEILTGKLTSPFSAEWVDIPRDPECLVCSAYYEQTDSAGSSLSLDMLLSESSHFKDSDLNDVLQGSK